jgi:hypothetical protein
MLDAKVLKTESNNTYSKHKESAHVSLIGHLIGHPCLDISYLDSHL